MPETHRLAYVYEGWEGYNRSLIHAIEPLTAENFAFGASDMRTLGELAWHIGDGRVDWFSRLEAPGSEALEAEIVARDRQPPASYAAQDVCAWLERTWQMVDATLKRWTVEDLPETFRQQYQGKVYAVSRQWVIWRIMCHDIHHGGQLSELLAMQGIFPTELTLLGGHLTEPPVIE